MDGRSILSAVLAGSGDRYEGCGDLWRECVEEDTSVSV